MSCRLERVARRSRRMFPAGRSGSKRSKASFRCLSERRSKSRVRSSQSRPHLHPTQRLQDHRHCKSSSSRRSLRRASSLTCRTNPFLCANSAVNVVGTRNNFSRSRADVAQRLGRSHTNDRVSCPTPGESRGGRRARPTRRPIVHRQSGRHLEMPAWRPPRSR